MAELEFRTQGTELPKGAREQLDEAMEFAAEAPGFLDVLPDTADEFDAVMLAGTDFPERPLTHGAPFGPGANAVPLPRESEQAFLRRIAMQMLEAGAPEDAKLWAARVIAGL